MKLPQRSVFAWALYDWANSAFVLVVMSGFFPIFYREFWASGQGSQAVTFQLGMINSLASLLIVLIAPFLGTLADKGRLKKRLLLLFCGIGILMALALWILAKGQWQLALMVYGLGVVGFMGANIFYDALLVDVSTPSHYDRHSALGFALGYLGGALLFSFCVWMTLSPNTFGLESAGEAVQFSFLLVAIWWLVFTLPLLWFVREQGEKKHFRTHELFLNSWQQLLETLRHIRQYRPVVIFLLAYWLYIDGVDTIIRMAVDYGKALGFESGDLIKALLLTQFVAFPAALLFGVLGERIGTRNALLIGLAVYMFVTAWASYITSSWEFYVLAVTIGLVQGGVQALSRSWYARLIPKDKAAEFFGFYNMLGKAAAVLGPVMVGWVSVATGSHRVAILSLLLLFIAGTLLLLRVPTEFEENHHE